MKTSSKSLAIVAFLAFASTPILVQAQDGPPPDPSYAPPPPDASGGGDSGASFQQFYDQLGSQGTWVQTDNYGYAFQPNVSDPNWAPYTDGHWAYTDVGWTWVSDEPWGWATYHYGRWANIDGTGWVWIPGTQWAPAWVSWRYGGGYCGWAPLPPETFVGVDFGDPGVSIGFGFHFGGDCDVNYGIGAGCYNFIPIGYIGDRGYRGRYLDRSRNYVVINNTTNITNINYNSREGGFRSVNVGGPNIREVNAQSHTHIQTLRLAEANQVGRSTVSGNTLNVYAPRISAQSRGTARPAQVAQTLSNVQLNRGDSINRPLRVNARVAPAAPSAEAIHAAEQARASAPASAHIAAEGAQPRTALTRPLTAMQVRAQTRQAAAVDNRERNQTNAQQEKDQRQTAAQERTAKVQQDEATHQQNQQTAAQERAARLQQEQADHQQNQQTAAQERAARLQQEQTDHQQNQQTAAQERAARLQQEEATRQQSSQDGAAQARDERAARLQQEHAAAVEQRSADRAPQEQQHVAPQPQQHVAQPQQRAAPEQRAAPADKGAPAQGNGQKGDKTP